MTKRKIKVDVLPVAGMIDLNADGSWQEGFEAYIAGDDQTANPNDPDTVEFASWELGWFAADKKARDERNLRRYKSNY